MGFGFLCEVVLIYKKMPEWGFGSFDESIQNFKS